MQITIFGSGYVGLVTGTCLADVGNHVLCVDVDENKIAQLQQGNVPIHEPGLESLLKSNFAAGRLQFTTDIAKAVAHGQIQCIAVGTPPDEDGSADLRYVLQVAETIGQHMTDYKLVMDKSTVPVGTADKVRQTVQAALDARGVVCDFDVVSNPEFLKEGAAIKDFMKPDRIVIGTDKSRPATLMRELYAPFNRNHDRLLVMDIRSAELTKYAANAMLATKISFMNEMAQIAERVGADIEHVRLGIGSDPRIGFHFIYPGAGYGGSCFHPEEVLFIDRGKGIECFSFEEVFALAKTEENIKVLSGDTNGFCFETLEQVSLRDYEDDLIEILFTLGKKIKVTKDHPVSVFNDGKLTVKLAETLEINDRVILPFGQFPQQDVEIDLLDEIKQTPLVEKVWLKNPAFANKTFNEHISSTGTFKVKDIINYKAILDAQYSDSVIFTSIAQPTTIPYKLPLNGDFARLIGYYVAEGWINAQRNQVGFPFEDDEYVNDVKGILNNLAIKFIERNDNGKHTVIISTFLLSYLFDDVLHCGFNACTKNIPPQIFRSPSEIQLEFIKGLLRGNGAISLPNKSKGLTIEYCTISKRLAQSLAVLLQSFKITSTVRTWFPKKLTTETYLVIINGLEHTKKFGEWFGQKWQTYKPIADNHRNIKARHYQTEKHFAIIKIKSLTKQPYQGKVYSIESANSHLISTNGILIHNCFPKDVQALVRTAQKVGAGGKILEAVETVNREQQGVLFQKIQQHFQGDLQNRCFALWGLAFKPDTDDMREAPSRKLMEALWAQGALVQAYDPEAMSEAQRLYGERADLQLCDTPEATLQGADALVIVTEWKLFRSPNFERIKASLTQPVIFDGRNLYEPDRMRERGFIYYAIGRGESIRI